MKTNTGIGIALASTFIFFASPRTHAIDGLKLSRQSANVVLSWPCLNDGSEAFIVQYRPNLNTNSAWQTLTSSLYADYGTNMAYFVHSNVVQSLNLSIGSGALSATSLVQSESALASVDMPPLEPMAKLADGSGSAAPVVIYPPGYDFSNFVILDPTTQEWVPGTGVIREAVIAAASASSSSLNSFSPTDDPVPPIPPGGSGGTNFVETGFYRVVRNGVHLVGITNNMTLSGIVTIPVEAGTDYGNLVSLNVREDGSPIGNSITMAPFQPALQLVLDTTAISNGVHQISGNASWNFGGNVFDAESPAITVNVHNELTFPNWIDCYGELYDSVLVTAESAHVDADWCVDIYGSDSGYVGSFGGHTYDGHIYASWNLVGPPPASLLYNHERYFDFVITTTWTGTLAPQGNGPQGGGSATATKRTYRQTDNWTTRGMWVVANQQAFNNLNGAQMLDEATDGFVTMAGGAGLTVRPPKTPEQEEGEAFRIEFDTSCSESVRAEQWQALRNALYNPESRNFFYLGHGGNDKIGFDETYNLSIPALEIAGHLHTIPVGQTNRHGYRFAMLFGCSTAGGNLPEAFGIIHRENVPSEYYVDAGLTPAAFVGWNDKNAAGILDSVLTENVYFLQHFQWEWSQSYGVRESLRRAKNNYPDVGFINFNKLKVFGNWELTYWGFN